MKGRILTLIAVAITLIPLRAADLLSEVERLYANASYEAALAMLDAGGAVDGPALASRRQYRALCLLALGRDAEARVVVADMVRAAPRTPLVGEDVPPRLSALARETQRALGPTIVRERYLQGRAALDRGDPGAAAVAFEEAIALAGDPALAPESITALGELRLLAQGFLDLARARAAVPASAPPVTVTAVPATAAAVPPPAAAAPPARQPAIPDREPIAISQAVPTMPRSIASFVTRTEGVLELLIDQDGHVTSARMVSTIHPTVDSLLLAAARTWTYQPAIHAGVAVPFRKIVHVTLGK